MLRTRFHSHNNSSVLYVSVCVCVFFVCACVCERCMMERIGKAYAYGIA